MTEQAWTHEQIVLFNRFRAQGISRLTIARRLGLGIEQVNERFAAEQPISRRMQATIDGAPLLEERDRLMSLPRTLTESQFGDPLPGRSALDRYTCGND